MKKLVLSGLLVACVLFGQGQQVLQPLKSTQPKFSAGFSPISLLFNKIRFELETGIGKQKPILLALSPIIYSGTTTSYMGTRGLQPDNQKGEFSPDQVSGFGAEAMLKFAKPLDPFELRMLYWGFGMGYHQINLEFEDFNFEPFNEDNLTYYSYQLADQTETIKRVDVFGLVGGRLYANNFFFFDACMGISYQNATVSSSLTVPRDQNSDPFRPGYSGLNYRFVLTAGISIF